MMNTESKTFNGHFAKARWLWWTQKVQPLTGILLKPHDNDEHRKYNR